CRAGARRATRAGTGLLLDGVRADPSAPRLPADPLGGQQAQGSADREAGDEAQRASGRSPSRRGRRARDARGPGPLVTRDQFRIGGVFFTGPGAAWVCTDIGTRVVV